MERYDAKHFIELKNWFNSADVVSPYTVFDISGNNYRLIAVVVYKAQACTITEILTHKEYDKGGWKK
jgi:mRNA interferase HigB